MACQDEKEMDIVKIAFSGFWNEFQERKNIFVNILKKNNFKIEIVSGKYQDADVLFYTNFSTDFYKYECLRIYITGENLAPDFNLCDYALGFEELTLKDRYMRMPLPYWEYRDDVAKAEKKRNIEFSEWKKRGFCAAVVSNGDYAESFRNDLLKVMISKGMVNSGGKYLNNIGQKNGVADKEDFIRQYRFSFALENCSHPGYCTEKIYQSFAAGTIPIYWGDPEVEKWLNGKAFINCSGFRKPEEAFAYIMEIAEDEERCRRMLEEPLYSVGQKRMSEYDKELGEWLVHIFSQGRERWFRRAGNGSIRFYEKNIADGIKTKILRERHPLLDRLCRWMSK